MLHNKHSRLFSCVLIIMMREERGREEMSDSKMCRVRGRGRGQNMLQFSCLPLQLITLHSEVKRGHRTVLHYSPCITIPLMFSPGGVTPRLLLLRPQTSSNINILQEWAVSSCLTVHCPVLRKSRLHHPTSPSFSFAT